MLEELIKIINKYKPKNILDLGTGSGILALEAAKHCYVDAVDIDKESLKLLKQKIKKEKIKNIKVFYSNLFNNVKRKYDLIVFNPPYLPYKSRENNENFSPEIFYKENIIKEFLLKAKYFLKEHGKVLFCFSSFSDVKEIKKALKVYKKSILLRKERFFFEDFYVYLAEK